MSEIDKEIEKLEARLNNLKKVKEEESTPSYTIIDGYVYRRVTDIREADIVFSNDGFWKKEGPAVEIKNRQLLEE